MKESKEIKQLRNKILGMEMEMSLLNRDLERFEAELVYNEKVLTAVDTNINFLKTKSIVVSLSEYKKIQQQKKLVLMKMDYYLSKLKPVYKALKILEDEYKQEMELFEKLYSLQFKSNILEFPSEQRRQEETNP